MVWKVKEALGRRWFWWFLLCMAHLTYRFSDGYWFVRTFSRLFLIESLHPIDKTWLVLIICLATIISYYHLVSIHEKNRGHYLLAASERLCKYICKLSIRSLGPLSLLLKHCLVVHVIMSKHAILKLVNSISNSFEHGKFILGIFIIYFSKVLDT